MDYPGRFNVITRALKEGGRRVRVRENVTKDAEVKVIFHVPRNGDGI